MAFFWVNPTPRHCFALETGFNVHADGKELCHAEICLLPALHKQNLSFVPASCLCVPQDTCADSLCLHKYEACHTIPAEYAPEYNDLHRMSDCTSCHTRSLLNYAPTTDAKIEDELLLNETLRTKCMTRKQPLRFICLLLSLRLYILPHR